MFAALAVPNFRRYVAGQSLSLVGTWVETVAQALLVLHLTHSGTISEHRVPEHGQLHHPARV
jgi:hypothetical protein